MQTIKSAEIFDSIIEYYRQLDQQEVLARLKDSKELAEYEEDVKDYVEREVITAQKGEAMISERRERGDYTAVMYPFRLFEEDQMETNLESMRRELPKLFSYLLRQVMYFETNYHRTGKGNACAVRRSDRSIIEAILTRAFSACIFDTIIGDWLHERIADNDYARIVELTGRLAEIIDDTDAPRKIKNDGSLHSRLPCGSTLRTRWWRLNAA